MSDIHRITESSIGVSWIRTRDWVPSVLVIVLAITGPTLDEPSVNEFPSDEQPSDAPQFLEWLCRTYPNCIIPE